MPTLGDMLERDGLLEQLANQPGEARSLVELTARARLRMKNIEDERRRRKDEEAQAYRDRQIAKMAPVPVRQPELFTKDQFFELARGIAPYFDEALARVLAPVAAHLAESKQPTAPAAAAPPGVGVVRVAPEVVEYIESAIRPIERQLSELDGAMRYEGVWPAGRTGYARGHAVTDRGAMWLAECETDTRPPGGHWKLIVKSATAKE